VCGREVAASQLKKHQSGRQCKNLKTIEIDSEESKGKEDVSDIDEEMVELDSKKKRKKKK